MSDATPDRGTPTTLITWMVILFGVLMVVLVALRRRDYPDGTIVNQQRTVVLENANPDMREVFADVVLGETSIEDLQALLGEPLAILEDGELAVWMFSQQVRTVQERALFGLVPTGSGQSRSQTISPVGVEGGLVIHTVAKPNPDEGTRRALERLWTAYHDRRSKRPPPSRAEASGE